MRASILALVVVVAVVVAAAAAAAGLGFPLRVLVCWKHPREWRNEGMEERRNEGMKERERKRGRRCWAKRNDSAVSCFRAPRRSMMAFIFRASLSDLMVHFHGFIHLFMCMGLFEYCSD